MAYHDITDPSYNDQLRMFETSDPVHADVYNAVAEQLILNDVAIRNGVGLSDSDEYDSALKFMAQKASGPVVIHQGNMMHLIAPNNAGAHNGIYRGKKLGTSVSAEQWAAIKAGTFDDMFIGDYWEINSVKWRIAAFDYWYHYGDTECTTHHVVIVPDSCIATSIKMNNSNVTTGAYIGCDYYTGANSNTGKATAKTAIEGAFGAAHILSHREFLANTCASGYETACSWYDSTFELMTEEMVYGGSLFHNQTQGTNFAWYHTIGHGQLPLFALDHSAICNRAAWWLRDVASSANFCNVNASGYANAYNASSELGIRPAFGIYQS